MEIKLQQKMSQQLVMTPQLQQAIKLLQLNRLELIDTVREELMQNPILEESGEVPEAERVALSGSSEGPVHSIDEQIAIDTRREGAASNPEEHRAAAETQQQEYWERYVEQLSGQGSLPGSGVRMSNEDLPSLEATLSTRTSLQDYLTEQLRLSNLNDDEMRFAQLVIHNLDSNGYLNLKAVPATVSKGKDREKGEKGEKSRKGGKGDGASVLVGAGRGGGERDEDLIGVVDDAEGMRAPLGDDDDDEELIGALASAQPEVATRSLTIEDLATEAGLDPEDAEEVLKLIQSLDPVGVASRDLRECLLVQAEHHGYESEDMVWQVIDRHLPNIEKKNFQAIARDLKCDVQEIYGAAKYISGLEPRPGRNYATDDPPYITPDVYVHKVGDDFVVTTNDDGLPKLKVNVEQATQLMKDPKAKEFVANKLASARWFVRSLDQRHKTIVKVTQCIVEKQRDFFERGIEFLRPMILRDVAETVGMHESTISRVTTNKYVHTPRGIFELKYFFNSSIRRIAEEDIASESVKQAIKKIIADEDPRSPLSDEQIVKQLEKQKIVIARRTVAKYREMLGILSSAKRKQYF